MNVRRLEVLFPAHVNTREYAIACAVWSALAPTGPIEDNSLRSDKGMGDVESREVFDEGVPGSS
ncbi:hypothetical protein [Saccharothrix syringae]|uniref:Uncharacterized protein n=1 Tax=Saccharothrix syringae TaxID=103733 RepID=A0A5Q0GUH8_SACSY|nr:hypothetical protein [Saccharothrix syringae]QFZ17727.1 hypothetical protein EKG83_09740 [Saccharothrix syringae]